MILGYFPNISQYLLNQCKHYRVAYYLHIEFSEKWTKILQLNILQIETFQILSVKYKRLKLFLDEQFPQLIHTCQSCVICLEVPEREDIKCVIYNNYTCIYMNFLCRKIKCIEI